MGEAIERLAHFIAGTPWDAIPKSVREHAKLVLLDTVGVILAGSVQPEVAGVRTRLTATGGHGATILAPGAPTSDPRTAAFLNGLAGRSIELCEGHRYVSCQGAVQALPTALACAEWLERSGRETLAGLIFGYEVAARLGAGLTARPLAHQNGQAPLLGAVGAGARVRGLNGDETSLALRLGAVLILTPAYTNAVAGATALNVAGGMSGFAGTLAPELALAGVAAQPNAIEEAFGQLVGDGFRPEAVTEELGQRWEITRNYFRLRACCNPIYSALDALEDILTEYRPLPENIARIDVATYRFAANMREPDPIQLLRGEVLAPARGGCADSPRERGVSRVHRRGGSRSRDRGNPPQSRCARGSCAQRQRAATQAGTGDRHAHRWASGHPTARERTRRLPAAVSRRRSSGEVSRAGGCGA
jgi:2-methylcitrate dehydratase PrpD